MMFGWFRRRDEDEDFDGVDWAEMEQSREEQVLRDMCMHIDAINALIPQMPKGIKPWMLWRPARLVLSMYTPGENEILHGDGIHRMEFD